MLVPEAKEALGRLKRVSANLGSDAQISLSAADVELLTEAGSYLNGARRDCEMTLDALDTLSGGTSGYSNPIADLAAEMEESASPDLKAIKEELDKAINTLQEYDEQ